MYRIYTLFLFANRPTYCRQNAKNREQKNDTDQQFVKQYNNTRRAIIEI